jgi:hypothetical protein
LLTANAFSRQYTTVDNTKKEGASVSKTLLFLSFIGLLFLIVGSILFPGSSVMWLASTAVPANILRIILSVVVVALLVTEPPRDTVFRMLVAYLAVGTGIWGAVAGYNNTIPLLDSASLLLASLSMGAVALEFRSNDRADDAYDEAAQAAITRRVKAHHITTGGGHAI